MEEIIDYDETSDYDKIIEIFGNVREEFCINDLIKHITPIVEVQIVNIKKAKEDEEHKEIDSLFVEMNRYADKIKEVKKEFKLKIKVPKIKTEEEIEAEYLT